MSLAQRTLRGIFWVYASDISGRIFTLISTAILARLLVPEQFGLIGFATLFVTFIDAARSFGFNEALIYNTEEMDKTADTTFVINALLGIGQFALAFFLAPLLTNLIDDPLIVDVARMTALTLVINGFGQTGQALLQKNLQFRRRFLPELIATFIKGAVSIVMALAGFGVWSIVVGMLIGGVVRAVTIWVLLDRRPKPRLYVDRARALWRYGVHILLFQLLVIGLEQADQLLIGTMLGQLQLGYFAIAVRIPEMVLGNMAVQITQVLFPTYAKMKDDLEQLASSFITATRYISYITIPIGIGLAAVAPDLVRVIFGPQWEQSIRLLQVLALLNMVNTLPWTAGDVLRAIGRPDVSTRLLMIEALYTFPLIIIMVSQTGTAVSASLANLIAMIITTVIRLIITSRFVHISPTVFLNVFRSPFISAALMFTGVSLWQMAASELPDAIVLIAGIILGAGIYGGMMWLLERDKITQARDMLFSMMKSKTAPPLADPSADSTPPEQESSDPPCYQITLSHDAAIFDELQAEWETLHGQSAANCLHLTWDWITIWWQHFGGDHELWLLQVRDEADTLVGLAPLMRARVQPRLGPAWRQLQFINTGTDCDHLDFIVRRGTEADVIPQIFETLKGHQTRWDTIYLEYMMDSSPSLPVIRAGCGIEWTELEPDVAPYIELPDNWDELFGKLSSNKRWKQRRYLKRLNKAHPDNWTFDQVTKTDELRPTYDDLVRLHQPRWEAQGQPGAFAAGARRDFHFDIAQRALERGWLRMYRLTIDGRIAAILHGFAYDDRMYHWANGLDYELSNLNPGHVFNQLILEDSIKSGMKEYDFLLGSEPYKYSWGAVDRGQIRLEWVASPRVRLQKQVINGLRQVKTKLQSKTDSAQSEPDQTADSDESEKSEKSAAQESNAPSSKQA